MPAVEIYTKPTCGFCLMAKRLLSDKGVSFSEIDVMRSPDRRQEMVARASGRMTVPQIFVDDAHVGGFEDLAALERAGKLDAMLGL